MRIIQANIWGGKLMYAIADFLKKETPDIVCMQEVHDLQGPSGAVFFSLGEIKDRCGFKYSYMSPTYKSHYQRRDNPFGNATLSNLPIKNRQTIFTHGEYNDNFDLTQDDFNVRNFQHLVLDCGGRDLNVLNHHGFLVEASKDGNAETERQMQQIADYISKLSGPVILCGDFNLWPESSSMAILNKILTDLPRRFEVKTTYNQFNSNKTVSDYIFVNEQIKVKDFKSVEDLISDHKPLILDFDI